MKILMVLDHEFPPDIRVENEIEALTENGNEIHIACYTMKGYDLTDSYDSATIHRRSISKLTHKTSVGAIKFPFYFNFWRSFIADIFKTEKFDAIHIHDLPLAKVGYEFAKKHNIKLTLDLHENWPALLRIATHTQSILGQFLSNDKEWIKYEIKYCKLADNVIVVVEEAKDRLINLGVEEDKISVVSNTLNTKHFDLTNHMPNPEFFTLLYAGGINLHRGLQYVIMGLKHLKNTTPKVRLQILGDGSYLPTLRKLAKDEGVEEIVEFTGWKPYKEMIKYVGEADVCLIPHVKNDHTNSTIPHKIFQYMYAGKPIIASDCLPIKRIINTTKSGLIYEYNNPKEFAKAVSSIISDEDLKLNLINSGKNKVLKDYSWEIDSKVLNQLYSG
ncbi:MAG: glycosyltransferase family 4 protein [Bacteroidetes bacterium]|nr:glycosyltransferase family 4 protein [Bacteroidota bacterium]